MLFIQAHGVFKERAASTIENAAGDGQSKHFNTRGNAQVGIIDAVSIHDRPQEGNDRMIPGHWELT